MTTKATSVMGLLALTLVSGCSSLEVARMPHDPKAAAEGVPYYPPRQDFVVTELGFDENGKPTPNITLTVDLVTRPDLEHGYLIRNSPGPFTSTEFSVTRDAQGRLLAVSGKVEDKTLETVTALASLVVKAAAFAGAEEAAKQVKSVDELQQELDQARQKKAVLDKEIEKLRQDLKQKPGDKVLLDSLKKKMDELKIESQKIKRILLEQEFLVLNLVRLKTLKTIEQLGSTVPVDGSALNQARENLAALDDRITAIEGSLAAASAPKGVTKSGYRIPTVQVAKDRAEAERLASALKADEISVFLVPKN
jgi:hypothetical protein